MRILLLSATIANLQNKEGYIYPSPHDVEIEIATPFKKSAQSAFDFDVTIFHITQASSENELKDYYENTLKIFKDVNLALQNDRVLIVIPQSKSFKAGGSGVLAYQWLENLGIVLRENQGRDIQATGIGVNQIFTKYLGNSTDYTQIIAKPENIPNQSRIAVVRDSDIVIGAEFKREKGTIAIIPPFQKPTKDTYFAQMDNLIEIARYYKNRMQRKVAISDTPSWINDYKTSQSLEVSTQISKLEEIKRKYETIEYSLYGTGEELEKSVALILEELGLIVEKQQKGANIDLKAKDPKTGLGFAIEVTGTKNILQKGSDKVSQAWQYISDRNDTSEESDRLIIVANTEYHLKPSDRKIGFSKNIVELLQKNNQ